eukprot:gene27193-2439_t
MSLKGTDTYDFPLSLSFRSISLETIMPKNSPEESDLKSEIEAPHLPEGVLRSIAQCLSGESSSILSLLAIPVLWRLSYQVTSRSQLDEALHALMNMQLLKHLELVVKSFTLCSDQLRMVGMLPLVELHLNSFIYKQQPTLSRSSYSHVDNEGVKALVDSICNRGAMKSEIDEPLKLVPGGCHCSDPRCNQRTPAPSLF